MSITDSWLRTAGAFSKEFFSVAGQTPPAIDARIARFSVTKVTAPVQKSKGVNTRAADRFVPVHQETFVTTSAGQQLPARIINLSSVAVAIEADFSRANPAHIVRIGTCRVRLGRSLLVGRVFFFERPLSGARCHRNVIL